MTGPHCSPTRIEHIQIARPEGSDGNFPHFFPGDSDEEVRAKGLEENVSVDEDRARQALEELGGVRIEKRADHLGAPDFEAVVDGRRIGAEATRFFVDCVFDRKQKRRDFRQVKSEMGVGNFMAWDPAWHVAGLAYLVIIERPEIAFQQAMDIIERDSRLNVPGSRPLFSNRRDIESNDFLFCAMHGGPEVVSSWRKHGWSGWRPAPGWINDRVEGALGIVRLPLDPASRGVVLFDPYAGAYILPFEDSEQLRRVAEEKEGKMRRAEEKSSATPIWDERWLVLVYHDEGLHHDLRTCEVARPELAYWDRIVVVSPMPTEAHRTD